MSQCTYLADGIQCEFPGAFSNGTLGDGRWMCALHHEATGQQEGAAIVARSKRWALLPNRAEAWVEMRRSQVYAHESPTVKKLREQIAAHRAGKPVGIVSSRIFRQPGEDEAAA